MYHFCQNQVLESHHHHELTGMIQVVGLYSTVVSFNAHMYVPSKCTPCAKTTGIRFLRVMLRETRLQKVVCIVIGH